APTPSGTGPFLLASPSTKWQTRHLESVNACFPRSARFFAKAVLAERAVTTTTRAIRIIWVDLRRCRFQQACPRGRRCNAKYDAVRGPLAPRAGEPARKISQAAENF